MILYHGTRYKLLSSILSLGLKPSGLGIVYLAPSSETARLFGEVVLKVETKDLRLTAFEDCRDWEVLCWGRIPPENIKAIEAL